MAGSERQTKTETLIEVMAEDVKEIKTCLFGNGKVGLKYDVVKTKMQVMLLMWVLSIVSIATVGLLGRLAYQAITKGDTK